MKRLSSYPAHRHAYTATMSKSAFAMPQSGQLHSGGTAPHGVPGAMPCSGMPSASS
ncbi:hypothetical protein CBM2586_A10225 [Cupriavidus phytorum]|uniref:Uncharacterized protein n=1 Tax=Cupriavidus taiwanensis TaxID=164546 RepID=A0A375B9J6_9BURK|nr:hypothetical protein CBM2586_A10225 [Cupriavidus taiwanensis]